MPKGKYKIKTLVLLDDIYRDIEVQSRTALVNAIENNKVLAIYENNKKIYIHAGYVVSFQE